MEREGNSFFSPPPTHLHYKAPFYILSMGMEGGYVLLPTPPPWTHMYAVRQALVVMIDRNSPMVSFVWQDKKWGTCIHDLQLLSTSKKTFLQRCSRWQLWLATTQMTQIKWTSTVQHGKIVSLILIACLFKFKYFNLLEVIFELIY